MANINYEMIGSSNSFKYFLKSSVCKKNNVYVLDSDVIVNLGKFVDGEIPHDSGEYQQFCDLCSKLSEPDVLVMPFLSIWELSSAKRLFPMELPKRDKAVRLLSVIAKAQCFQLDSVSNRMLFSPSLAERYLKTKDIQLYSNSVFDELYSKTAIPDSMLRVYTLSVAIYVNYLLLCKHILDLRSHGQSKIKQFVDAVSGLRLPIRPRGFAAAITLLSDHVDAKIVGNFSELRNTAVDFLHIDYFHEHGLKVVDNELYEGVFVTCDNRLFRSFGFSSPAFHLEEFLVIEAVSIDRVKGEEDRKYISQYIKEAQSEN